MNRVNIQKIRNKAKVYLNGLMVGNMMVNGMKVNNMDKEIILIVLELLKGLFGRMGRELNG